MTAPRHTEAGMTLVEVLVALALFAVIGVAGFAMLDQVLRVQARTEGRLDRLGGLQRAQALVAADFAAARPDTLEVTATDGGPVVRLRRRTPEGWVALAYGVEEGMLVRTVAGTEGAVAARQPLVPGVAGAAWRWLGTGDAGWQADWPPPGAAAGLPGAAPPAPRAVELRLDLADGTALRRVALMPAVVQ